MRNKNYTRQPIRYAIPPQRGQAGAVPAPAIPDSLASANLSVSGFTIRATGVKGAYPKAVLITAFAFNQPVAIINVTMASSIVNTAAGDVAIVVVHKNTGATLGLDQGSDFLMEHVVEQGLSHSQRSGTSFLDNIAPTFGTNEQIGLYAVMAAAGCAFTAMVTLRYLVTT